MIKLLKTLTMRIIYSMILFLFSCALFSQNKTIVPQSGTIVFSSKEIITDQALYTASLKAFKKKMLAGLEEEIILERLTFGMKTDAIQLKEAVNMVEENISSVLEIKNNFDYRHEFNGSIIKSYQTFGGEVLEENVINTKTGMKNNTEYYSYNEIFDLHEFRNEIKKVNGFDCYKVTYSYKEESSSGFNDFFNGYINFREMWVTEKIKCAFHPVVNDRLILEKYYPLEISNRSDAVKGCETKYSLVSIEIN